MDELEKHTTQMRFRKTGADLHMRNKRVEFNLLSPSFIPVPRVLAMGMGKEERRLLEE